MSVPASAALLRSVLNRRSAEADLHGMTVFTVLISLGFAYLVAVLVLGVMASRVDDSHRFVKLIAETRQIRRHFEAPLENAKREQAARDKGGSDDIWPEAL